MDVRTRANDRRILVNQLLEKYPGMDAEIAQQTIARSGTVHEQNERFGRNGDRYYPVKIGDAWYIGLGTLIGTEDDPAVRAQVNELNRSGISVSDALDRIDTDLIEPVDQRSPRAENTSRQRILRENPLPDLTPAEPVVVPDRIAPTGNLPQADTPVVTPAVDTATAVEQTPVALGAPPSLTDVVSTQPAPVVQASNSATGGRNLLPRPAPPDVTELRRNAQQAAFEELAVDLNGEIDLARQEQIEQVNRANSLARENLTLAGANAAQNGFENIELGTTFDNLDALSNATSETFGRANLTNSLAGIRGIGAGTDAPSVGDLTKLIRSQRQVEDTLRQNRDFLEDDTRLELSARAQAVEQENARRSLIGLAPIDLQDTINPAVREESFEANRARAQIASIIPSAESSLLAGDQAATALIEEQEATRILNDEAAATISSLLSRIDDPLERARLEIVNPGLMTRFRE